MAKGDISRTGAQGPFARWLRPVTPPSQALRPHLNPGSLDLNPGSLDLNPGSPDLNPGSPDLNPGSPDLNPRRWCDTSYPVRVPPLGASPARVSSNTGC